MTHTVYSVGHSTLQIIDFIALIQVYGIEMLVDVRRFPQSRRNPQFNQDVLSNELKVVKMGYIHLEGLGGRRQTSPASINTAWKNLSFRGYADYMQTVEFATNLEQLAKIAGERRTAIMCAEAVPWRCHRSLIADALLVRGFQVEDILSVKTSKPHQLTAWAKVVDGAITYPQD